jgi:hypothetical protein
MRDYSKVSGAFWTGSTGKALRGDAEAQLVCLYLMTSPHANLIGVYHCPVLYIAHETGLSIEGASKGLRRAIEGGFCTYDEASEVVFVHAFARYQLLEGLAEALKPGDKRVVAVLKAVSQIAEPSIRAAFVAHYASVIPGLEAAKTKGHRRGFEGPPMPEAGTEAGTEAEDPPNPPAGGKADDESPKAKGLASITDDVVAAFNASRLVKANGGLLAGVNPAVGRELRQRQVSRAVKLAREIAEEMGTALDREWWGGYFDACFADDFIAGRRSGGRDHSNWIADFEYLVRPKTIDKVYRQNASGAA